MTWDYCIPNTGEDQWEYKNETNTKASIQPQYLDCEATLADIGGSVLLFNLLLSTALDTATSCWKQCLRLWLLTHTPPEVSSNILLLWILPQSLLLLLLLQRRLFSDYILNIDYYTAGSYYERCSCTTAECSVIILWRLFVHRQFLATTKHQQKMGCDCARAVPRFVSLINVVDLFFKLQTLMWAHLLPCLSLQDVFVFVE